MARGPKKAIDESEASRQLDRQRQIVANLRKYNALERAAQVEVDRLVSVALQAGVPVDTVVKIVDDGQVKVFVERTDADGKGVIATAIRIARGRVVSVMPRKLRGDRDCDPRGRAGPGGELGDPVWRVVIERGAR